MRTTCAILLMAAAFTVAAQAKVGDVSSREQAIQRSQQSTGAAYRDLQQARHESKLAEQDFLNAQEASRAAQQRAEEARRQHDVAKKSLDVARAKEAQSQKRYDDALKGVDRAFEKPSVKSP